MNEKVTRKCSELVAPLLTPGETIESVEVAQIGKPSKSEVAAVAVASAIVSGGVFTAVLRPQPYFLVFTRQRVFLVENNMGSVGKQVFGSVPLKSVTTGPLRTHVLRMSMEVVLDGEPRLFSWGRFQAKDARRVAEKFGANPDL